MLALKTKDIDGSTTGPVTGSRLGLVVTTTTGPGNRLGPQRIRQVATALLESIAGRLSVRWPILSCPMCQWIPLVPVTLPCGHTACKSCLVTVSDCPQCSTPLPANVETNVLLKTAVEKWWASEVEASHIKEQGDALARNNFLERALDKYNAALQIAPHDHLLLEARADVLLRLNRCEASLTDAQELTRLRPFWSKGYYRRGVVLAGLGHYEDALLSFSMCMALEKTSGRVKQQFIKTLHSFVTPVEINKNLMTSKRLPISPWWSSYSTTLEFDTAIEDDDSINPFSKTVIPAYHCGNTWESKLHELFDKIFDEIEKTKKIDTPGRSIVLRRELVDPDDFECVLCCRTLWRPVTTSCGHTYCSMCLERCLDYSSNCPLCMTSLGQFLGNSEKPVTEFLETALSMSLPEEFASRLMAHRQEVAVLVHAPDVPVFVCTTAFPAVPCPLFVFEPRYRLMVRRAIESGGRFGMAACVHQRNGIKRFAEYGTILEIKDVVLLNDGCSILSNIGSRRFRVISRGERDGYDTAQVQYIADDPVPQHLLPELCSLHDRVRERGLKWFQSMSGEMQTKILRTFGEMPPLESNWSSLKDGPAWAWWLVAILPLGPHLQQGILSTTCLEKRLRAIEKTLRHFEEGPASIEADSDERGPSLTKTVPSLIPSS